MEDAYDYRLWNAQLPGLCSSRGAGKVKRRLSCGGHRGACKGDEDLPAHARQPPGVQESERKRTDRNSLLRQRGWQYHTEAGRGGAEGGVGTESAFRMVRRQ